MSRAKIITSEALKSCEKDERQNIIWIDSHLDSWLETLSEIILGVEL